jgi:hypothetical protein
MFSAAEERAGKPERPVCPASRFITLPNDEELINSFNLSCEWGSSLLRWLTKEGMKREVHVRGRFGLSYTEVRKDVSIHVTSFRVP